MARKRKASGRSGKSSSNADAGLESKFDINETFEDSEDEFMAGRDQILLEEGPEAKRRRKLDEDGWDHCCESASCSLLTVLPR